MNRFVVVLLASCVLALGPVQAQETCGSSVRPEEVQDALALQASGIYDEDGIPSLGTLFVPVAFHVVRQNNGSGGLSQSRLNTAINDANLAFAGAGIGFFQCMDTDYIDSDAFYFNINTGAEIDALRRVNPVADAINVYCTPNLQYCGISSFTNSSVQGIVMLNSCMATSTNHSTFSHEIGHYFNLYHTHEGAFGQECTSGSNCSNSGDLVCDTPADPGLGTSNVNSSCVYTGGGNGPCGGDPGYSPDPRNYMSYSRKSCRNRFSSQQNSRARSTLLNLRPELLGGCTPPDLISVAPSQGELRGGDSVTLVGTNFSSNATVRFAGLVAQVDQRIGSTQIIATAPEGTTEGQDAAVSVTQPSGSDQINNAYEYLPNTPYITWNGPARAGQNITISLYGPAGDPAGLAVGVPGITVKPCCTFCLERPISFFMRPSQLTLGSNGRVDVIWNVEGDIFETKKIQGLIVTSQGPQVTNCTSLTVFP